ncbi:MAG: M23 family metallopeptidase, partial [Actinomycetota bacterium]|nr:M23 family metallopeptidase [Actinomycetota bacterium]
RLERAQAELVRHSRELGVGAVSAYKYGGEAGMVTAVVGALTGSGSVTDFLASVDKLSVGVVRKREIVERVDQLLREVERRNAEIRLLREQRVAEEIAAAKARDQVAQLTARQVALVVGIDAERLQRAQALAALEVDKAHYETLIDRLGQESADLREQLRGYRLSAGAPGTGELIWPTDGPLTSEFGSRQHPIFGTARMHEGIDIGAPSGQPILAAAAGQVVHAGPRGGYGNVVAIDHGGGLSTLYAHQSQVLVSLGDVVGQGDLIGLVGSTGYSTGPHLHFEVRVDGVPHDPMAWY